MGEADLIPVQESPVDTERLLFEPNISINGPIDEKMLASFLEQIVKVRCGNQDLVLEINTIGGDADVARRIALEVRLFRTHSGRRAFCIGKTFVYSAGLTILASFKTANRYLTSDTVLLIHERRISESLELSGPMAACIQIVREKLSMLETGQRLERQGFEELLEESRLSMTELFECAQANCYLNAQDALAYGIIGNILA
ncbi:ATP-dependent Clp protease proteolytic subunit [Rhizobium cauense]|uniref:ATP-dependent Clp protease proteolytic subunit n=1 Tax=Rhizobium cauense TaxID=1166683 RepID=UPI001C6E842C|nr:ATP-dependent Clp protease proteolytic subunit [Rhizobium cauense]